LHGSEVCPNVPSLAIADLFAYQKTKQERKTMEIISGNESVTNVTSLTPLMKQYWEIKSLHADKILLFRMGDFFEIFHEDAVRAAPLLGIALTQRNKKSQDDTPMCGVPHHSIAGPINKLLARGFKVAICDQIEDPKFAKGIVKRAVTRVLTPGMVFDPDTLDGRRPHYLASFDEAGYLSFLDTTTGESFYLSAKKTDEKKKYLELLSVAEVVLEASQSDEFSRWGIEATVSIHSGQVPLNHFLLQSAGDLGPVSAARLLSYVQSLSGDEIFKALAPFEFKDVSHRLRLSPTVLKHLEIFKSYKGEEAGSFFNAIDRTKSSTGCRLLRQWVGFPLTDVVQIERRLERVEYWQQDLLKLENIRKILGQMGDLERRLAKVSQTQCNGRDVLSFAVSLRAGIASLEKSEYQMIPTGISKNLFSNQQNLWMDRLKNLTETIENTLLEEQPLSTKQGYLIRRGLLPALDELIELSTNSQELLAKMEQRERETTGIASLKIRYNNVFGYYIEITHLHKDKVPGHYQRKQTLANAERYCTEELIALERKILSAQTKRSELEFQIFEELRQKIIQQASEVLQLSHVCSELDVITSLAFLALEQNYVRPMWDGNGNEGLHLQGSRHPVIEQFLKKQFVPNDIYLKDQACLLLTGPNMAGKSTLMRQVALTVILAQLGSYVPASCAKLAVRDAIFTRIGASDMLTEGLSTFMVEMTETAHILKEATPRSLVILDEIGRGTSTYDGMSLAQSILEFLLTEVRCLTLFATHYHELTNLSHDFPQIENAHMAISEHQGQIRFLHTLVRGPAMKSYGVHVAELAGLPLTVTKRAKGLLRQLEKEQILTTSQMSFIEMVEDMDYEKHQEREIDILTENTKEWSRQAQAFLQEVERYPTMEKTPLQALSQIGEWQNQCRRLVPVTPT